MGRARKTQGRASKRTAQLRGSASNTIERAGSASFRARKSAGRRRHRQSIQAAQSGPGATRRRCAGGWPTSSAFHPKRHRVIQGDTTSVLRCLHGTVARFRDDVRIGVNRAGEKSSPRPRAIRAHNLKGRGRHEVRRRRHFSAQDHQTITMQDCEGLVTPRKFAAGYGGGLYGPRSIRPTENFTNGCPRLEVEVVDPRPARPRW